MVYLPDIEAINELKYVKMITIHPYQKLDKSQVYLFSEQVTLIFPSTN